jgi:hypothetical protein
MFYAHEVRNLLRLAIFEHRRGRLGSKISSYGQLAEVAVYVAMSGLPPEADTNRKGRHVRSVPLAEAMLMAEFVCIRRALAGARKRLETGPA